MELLEVGTLVAIRHPTPADADEWMHLREISRPLFEPWEPARPDNSSPSDRRAFGRYLSESDCPTRQRHLIIERSSGAIAGGCSLNDIVMSAFCSANAGYWMGLPFAGKGYMSAGLALVIRRAFTTLGLHRVEANIIPSNVRSLSVARRCGMKKEGYSPRYLQIGGRWQDHERWAITIEDWHESQILAR